MATLPSLKLGSTGRAVGFLQARLGVIPTGTFDAGTVTMLKAAQLARGLTADGVYGPLTNAALTGHTDANVKAAAALIGLTLPEFGAVLMTETGGAGFLSDGRPKILLERHYVYRLAPSSVAGKLPADICSPTPGGYVGGVGEWDRFERVAAVAGIEIAVRSCSWGMGQIMGDAYKQLGYGTAAAFMADAAKNELTQIAQFAHFLETANIALLPAIRAHQWATVARIYNGAGYLANSYDTKLAAAYTQLLGAGGMSNG
jgi:hypothetical protein